VWNDEDVLWLYYTELQSRSKARIPVSERKPDLGQQEHDSSEPHWTLPRKTLRMVEQPQLWIDYDSTEAELPWECEYTEDEGAIARG